MTTPIVERTLNTPKRKPGGQPTTAESFWARVDRTGDCWIWTGGLTDKGYGSVGFQRHSSIGAHRVSWALTHGGALPDEWVLHHCDNPPCVRPSHLFLGDAVANNQDRQAKGRTRGFVTRTGSQHHRYSVSPQVMAAARTLRAQGWTQQHIADETGVSRGHVAHITRGVLPLHTKGTLR